MDFKNYKYLIYTDLYRIEGYNSAKKLWLNLFFNVGFRYCFLLRSIKYLRTKKILKILFYPFIRLLYKHDTYKFGIEISSLNIGAGFYISHFGGIFINRDVIIGNNVNVSQDITIGIQNRGPLKGCPSIGNNVYIGPGAKLFGNISIGDNSAIGANCVATKDVPANSVVVGVPGKVISNKGSVGYINNTDYLNFDDFDK